MELEDLTIEQAEEMFNSEKGRQAWKIVTTLVGSPVEYAFKDDYIMKLSLVAAFSAMFIHRDKTAAEDALEYLRTGCITHFDKAVWALSMGTYNDWAGELSQAEHYYVQAIEQYFGTYIAHLRLARIAHEKGDSCTAEKHCRQGLECLRKSELNEQHILKEIEAQFMGLLDAILNKITPKKNSEKKSAVAEVLHEKSLEEIWRIEDKTNLIIALSGYLAEKSRYGDEMSAFSEPEKIVYITQSLEMEVNNGGFSQFFFNSSGDFANEVVDAFMEIGAKKTAAICRKANSIYGETVPHDRDEREDLLLDNDEIENILDECDNAFFEYEDDLVALCYEYVMKHKKSFT